MNAIERLHRMAYDLCGDDRGSTWQPCRETFDAVAAVDALYQAASSIVNDVAVREGAVAHLAAAVRRVEADA